MEKGLKTQIRQLEERLEALIIAVPKKESEYYFYLELANTTDHEGTRKMFLKLAEQELRQKQNLEKVVEHIREELIRLRTKAEERT